MLTHGHEMETHSHNGVKNKTVAHQFSKTIVNKLELRMLSEPRKLYFVENFMDFQKITAFVDFRTVLEIFTKNSAFKYCITR